MSIQIGQALSRGTRRSISVSGSVLLVSVLLHQLVVTGAINTILFNFLPESAQPANAAAIGFTLPVSVPVAAAIGGVALLFGVGIFLTAARLLVRDLSELGSLPAELLTHRFGWAFLSTLVVSLVLGIVVPFGLLLFVIPGLFLGVSFQFAVFAIAVEDLGPIAALRRSWELATGNRWRLAGLLLLITVASGIAGGASGLFSLVDPMVGQLVSLGVNSVFVILLYGILADAFVQLREEPVADSGAVSGPGAL